MSTIRKQKIQTMLTLDFYKYHNDPELFDILEVFESVYYSIKIITADDYKSVDYAVAINNLELVKYLFSEGIHKISKNYVTVAIKNNNLEIVKYLSEESPIGDELINYAIDKENFEIVKHLVSKRSKDLHLHFQWSNEITFKQTLMKGNFKMIKYLFSKRTMLNNNAFNIISEINNDKLAMYVYSKLNTTMSEKHYLLKSASEHGHLELIKHLVSLGADVTKYSNYSLRYASKNGHFKVVKYLISQGAGITDDHNFAVRMASLNGHLELVKYLVSKGAKL